jgi:hypothetical protein
MRSPVSVCKFRNTNWSPFKQGPTSVSVLFRAVRRGEKSAETPPVNVPDSELGTHRQSSANSRAVFASTMCLLGGRPSGCCGLDLGILFHRSELFERRDVGPPARSSSKST